MHNPPPQMSCPRNHRCICCRRRRTLLWAGGRRRFDRAFDAEPHARLECRGEQQAPRPVYFVERPLHLVESFQVSLSAGPPDQTIPSDPCVRSLGADRGARARYARPRTLLSNLASQLLSLRRRSGARVDLARHAARPGRRHPACLHSPCGPGRNGSRRDRVVVDRPSQSLSSPRTLGARGDPALAHHHAGAQASLPGFLTHVEPDGLPHHHRMSSTVPSQSLSRPSPTSGWGRSRDATGAPIRQVRCPRCRRRLP